VVKNVGDVHLGGEAVAFADFAAVRNKGVGLPRVGRTVEFASAANIPGGRFRNHAGLFSVIPFASDPKAVLSVMLISRLSGGIRKSVLGRSVRAGDGDIYFALPEYLITRKLKFLAKAAATSVGAIAVGCCW
jgi:hypothetical protein